MTKFAVTWLKKVLLIIPLGASTTIYKTLLRPAPLRNLANKIICSGIPKSMDIPEGTIILNKADAGVSGMLALGAYEPYETNFFRSCLKPGMTVIDIGANIGLYTIIAASKVTPSGKVIAYEPEPHNFLLLKENIKINNFKNVTAIEEGISDTTTVQSFFLTPENKGTHSLIDNRETNDSITIKTTTLDESLKKQNISHVDLIKIDIEGIEIIALPQMKNAILANPNLILITEIYPQAIRRLGRQPIEYLEKLCELGFSLSIIEEDKKSLVSLPPSNFESFIKAFPKGEVVKNLYAVRS